MGLTIMSVLEVPSPDRFREMLGLPVDPESVLRDVLSRDEFRESPVQSLVDRLNEVIVSGIQHILSWIAKHWPHFGAISGNYDFLWTILGSLFYAVILGTGGRSRGVSVPPNALAVAQKEKAKYFPGS